MPSETTRTEQREIDLPGQIAAIAALGSLAGAIIEGGALGWDHPLVVAGFAAFAVCAVLFVWREARAPQPMLPLALFRNRMFALASLIGLLVNVAVYGLIFVLSLYFQQVNGLSAFATGLAFVPMLGAVLPVNLIAPRLAERIGAPATIAAGAALSAAGCLALLGIEAGTGYWAICVQLIAHEHRSRIAGAATDVDDARQRREIALGHRRRRAQRDPTNRQRAGRRLVRFAGRPVRCVHERPACVADDLGRRVARSRGRDLVGRPSERQ